MDLQPRESIGFRTVLAESRNSLVSILFFGITTVIGLYAMIYEYLRYNKVSLLWKGIGFVLTGFVSFYFLFYEIAMMNISTMVWHIGHIFFTHTLGSFIPIAIADAH